MGAATAAPTTWGRSRPRCARPGSAISLSRPQPRRPEARAERAAPDRDGRHGGSLRQLVLLIAAISLQRAQGVGTRPDANSQVGTGGGAEAGQRQVPRSVPALHDGRNAARLVLAGDEVPAPHGHRRRPWVLRRPSDLRGGDSYDDALVHDAIAQRRPGEEPG